MHTIQQSQLWTSNKQDCIFDVPKITTDTCTVYLSKNIKKSILTLASYKALTFDLYETFEKSNGVYIQNQNYGQS